MPLATPTYGFSQVPCLPCLLKGLHVERDLQHLFKAFLLDGISRVTEEKNQVTVGLRSQLRTVR